MKIIPGSGVLLNYRGIIFRDQGEKPSEDAIVQLAIIGWKVSEAGEPQPITMDGCADERRDDGDGLYCILQPDGCWRGSLNGNLYSYDTEQEARAAILQAAITLTVEP